MNVCLPPCTVNAAEPLDPWNPPTPPGGSGLTSVATGDSISIIFTGDGTENNPIVATVEGTIEFEIAFPRVAGFGDAEVLSAYATAKGFTLRAGLPGATVAVQGAAGDFRINLYRQNVLIGYIQVTAGVATYSFVSDVVFAPDDLLEFRSVTAQTFTLLAVTLVGERDITFV